VGPRAGLDAWGKGKISSPIMNLKYFSVVQGYTDWAILAPFGRRIQM